MKNILLAFSFGAVIFSTHVSAYTINTEKTKNMSKNDLLEEYYQLADELKIIDKKEKNAFIKNDIRICDRYKDVDGELSYNHMTDVDYGQRRKFTSLCNFIRASL